MNEKALEKLGRLKEQLESQENESVPADELKAEAETVLAQLPDVEYVKYGFNYGSDKITDFDRKALKNLNQLKLSAGKLRSLLEAGDIEDSQQVFTTVLNKYKRELEQFRKDLDEAPVDIPVDENTEVFEENNSENSENVQSTEDLEELWQAELKNRRTVDEQTARMKDGTYPEPYRETKEEFMERVKANMEKEKGIGLKPENADSVNEAGAEPVPENVDGAQEVMSETPSTDTKAEKAVSGKEVAPSGPIDMVALRDFVQNGDIDNDYGPVIVDNVTAKLQELGYKSEEARERALEAFSSIDLESDTARNQVSTALHKVITDAESDNVSRFNRKNKIKKSVPGDKDDLSQEQLNKIAENNTDSSGDEMSPAEKESVERNRFIAEKRNSVLDSIGALVENGHVIPESFINDVNNYFDARVHENTNGSLDADYEQKTREQIASTSTSYKVLAKNFPKQNSENTKNTKNAESKESVKVSEKEKPEENGSKTEDAETENEAVENKYPWREAFEKSVPEGEEAFEGDVSLRVEIEDVLDSLESEIDGYVDSLGSEVAAAISITPGPVKQLMDLSNELRKLIDKPMPEPGLPRSGMYGNDLNEEYLSIYSEEEKRKINEMKGKLVELKAEVQNELGIESGEKDKAEKEVSPEHQAYIEARREWKESRESLSLAEKAYFNEQILGKKRRLNQLQKLSSPDDRQVRERESLLNEINGAEETYLNAKKRYAQALQAVPRIGLMKKFIEARYGNENFGDENTKNPNYIESEDQRSETIKKEQDALSSRMTALLAGRFIGRDAESSVSKSSPQEDIMNKSLSYRDRELAFREAALDDGQKNVWKTIKEKYKNLNPYAKLGVGAAAVGATTAFSGPVVLAALAGGLTGKFAVKKASDWLYVGRQKEVNMRHRQEAVNHFKAERLSEISNVLDRDEADLENKERNTRVASTFVGLVSAKAGSLGFQGALPGLTFGSIFDTLKSRFTGEKFAQTATPEVPTIQQPVPSPETPNSNLNETEVNLPGGLGEAPTPDSVPNMEPGYLREGADSAVSLNADGHSYDSPAYGGNTAPDMEPGYLQEEVPVPDSVAPEVPTIQQPVPSPETPNSNLNETEVNLPGGLGEAPTPDSVPNMEPGYLRDGADSAVSLNADGHSYDSPAYGGNTAEGPGMHLNADGHSYDSPAYGEDPSNSVDTEAAQTDVATEAVPERSSPFEMTLNEGGTVSEQVYETWKNGGFADVDGLPQPGEITNQEFLNRMNNLIDPASPNMLSAEEIKAMGIESGDFTKMPAGDEYNAQLLVEKMFADTPVVAEVPPPPPPVEGSDGLYKPGSVTGAEETPATADETLRSEPLNSELIVTQNLLESPEFNQGLTQSVSEQLSSLPNTTLSVEEVLSQTKSLATEGLVNGTPVQYGSVEDMAKAIIAENHIEESFVKKLGAESQTIFNSDLSVMGEVYDNMSPEQKSYADNIGFGILFEKLSALNQTMAEGSTVSDHLREALETGALELSGNGSSLVEGGSGKVLVTNLYESLPTEAASESVASVPTEAPSPEIAESHGAYMDSYLNTPEFKNALVKEAGSVLNSLENTGALTPEELASQTKEYISEYWTNYEGADAISEVTEKIAQQHSLGVGLSEFLGGDPQAYLKTGNMNIMNEGLSTLAGKLDSLSNVQSSSLQELTGLVNYLEGMKVPGSLQDLVKHALWNDALTLSEDGRQLLTSKGEVLISRLG